VLRRNRRVARCPHSPTGRTGPACPTIEMSTVTAVEYKSWMCLVCGWVYDESAGLPEEGIVPGTRWDDVPPNWTCPECGARKEDFEMVEL
jgi:rubredoxin